MQRAGAGRQIFFAGVWVAPSFWAMGCSESVAPGANTDVTITGGPAAVRQGDVAVFTAAVTGGRRVGYQPGSGTCAWAPQLHQGNVWVSDLNTGLWTLRLAF